MKIPRVPRRPVLSQVKQKTPIILPGFEVVDVPDEFSGQSLVSCIYMPFFDFSVFIVVIDPWFYLCDQSENSQLETKLSGLPVASVGKRDSMLGRAAELNDEKKSKSVSVSRVMHVFSFLLCYFEFMIATVGAIYTVELCADGVFFIFVFTFMFNSALLFLKIKREPSLIQFIYCDTNSVLC